MNVVRGLAAVIIGYLIMSLASMAAVSRLFGEGQDAPEARTVWMSMLGLAIVAAVGGFICTLVVGSANSPAIYIAIGLLFLVAGRAQVLELGIEPGWYRLASSVALAVGFLVGASTAAYKLDRR